MGSRNPEKEMLKNHVALETYMKLAEAAIKSSKSSSKKLLDLRTKLEESFLLFNQSFHFYKCDAISKECQTEEAFNKEEEGVQTYPYNDTWSDAQMAKYIEKTESIEDKVKEKEKEEIAQEIKPSVENTDYLEGEIESDKNSLVQSVDSFANEVNSADKITLTVASAMEKYCDKLKERCGLLVQKSRQADIVTKQKINDVITLETAKLDSTLLQICTKVEDTTPASPQEQRISSGPHVREQVHLEKSKPPRFKGDVVEYPEFKRKWLSVVSKANLPEESEIDKLRDHIPADAREQLYGVKTMVKSWEILDKRFGDSRIISMKLKNQLKSVQSEGSSDPDKVISLTIKVRTIVTKLESLNMHGALEHDSEFLSAVYCALPPMEQRRWLEYQKSSNHWADLMKFLEKAYDHATEELSLLATYSADKKSKPQNKTFATTVKSQAEDSDKDEAGRKEKARQKAEEFCGKCPVCSTHHTWVRRKGDKWPSDRLLSCQKFLDMSVTARARAVEKCKGCPRCTSWNHTRDKCKMPSNSCNKDDSSGVKCQGDHSRLLCGSGVPYCAAAKFKPSRNARPAIDTTQNSVTSCEAFEDVDQFAETIPYFQDIPLEGTDEEARVFWDDGSTRVLIREEFAEQLHLVRREVKYSLEVVGSVQERTGYIYLLSLVDMYGQSHRIWGYGMDRIMLSSVPDLSALESLFPHVPGAAFKAMREKEVDILIGLNMNEIFPDGGAGVDKKKGIKVKRSLFGTGWCVGGVLDQSSQPASTGSVNKCSISPQAALVRSAKVNVVPEPPLSPDFWETDQMGVAIPPRCDRCRRCQQVGVCSESHAQHTIKAQAELDLIKANTKLVNGEIWCSYPFVKDPVCLPNNRGAAVRVAEKVWNSLKKDGLLPAYNEQVQQILDRKAAVKLSKEEMEDYEGPFQYISHHPVLKDSVSTPVRMVTNSSFNNAGNSLNSCLAAGPNSLNPMVDVVLRFRCREVGMQYDLSKAYNTMRTGLKERHLRRWVWKFNEEDDWADYAFDCVHFGDCCAATQLEVAKDLVADAGEYIDPVASPLIKDDTYVDDGLTGGSPEQVARFLGKKQADGNFDGTFAQILALGNFKMKGATYSGDTDKDMIAKLGGNVCGYSWDVTNDVLGVKFVVNLSKKRRSVRSEPDITVSDLEKLRQTHLSKRNLMGFVNGLSDPLGIGSPWYMKQKLLMKKLFELENPLSWDDKIPDANREGWIEVMTEALVEGTLPFPRSTRPEHAVGVGPLVVGFGDGAIPGYGGSIYLQWQVECCHGGDCTGAEDGDFDANLCMSKARVCPLRGYTVPRSELCGGLLTSRLLVCVVRALQKLEEKPIGAVMLLDSRCIISALEMTSTKMLPFFQNRLAEIHENLATVDQWCPVEPVHWVESSLNPADLCTRGTVSLKDIGPGSFHQKGPNFLSFPRESWPVTRDFVPEEVPGEEMRTKKVDLVAALKAMPGVTAPVMAEKVEAMANYSHCLTKVHRIIARVCRGWSKKFSKKNPISDMKITSSRALSLIASEPTGDEIERAKLLLLVHAMPATVQALDEGKLSSLLPARKGKLIVTTGRLGEKNMSRLLGVEYLPILMPHTRTAYLYMNMAHRSESGLSNTAVEHHRAAVGTLARSRTYVWVVRGKALAKQVVKNCFVCRRERKRMESQLMGMMQEAHLTVSPPWTFVSLDFAGPVEVGGEVQRRIKMKCWILVYVDQASRAVCMLLTSGYSTQDFLTRHTEYCARKGIPRRILSDKGSQLVAGSKVVAKKDLPAHTYDWDRVTEQNIKTTWEFVPAGCQWRNQTEAMVKVLKTALNHALPAGKVLSYSEMVTLLARIAFSVNSRPLALAHTSSTSQQEDDMMPLTPNQLLLGHNTSEKPGIGYQECDKYSARLNYIHSLHREWWRRWIEDVLPTLVPCRKWQKRRRNLKVGDVVMMWYQGNLVDDYRLALVSKVYPDDKDVVRTVQVTFRRRNSKEKPEVCRTRPLMCEDVGVQRLSLLQAVGEEPPTGLE